MQEENNHPEKIGKYQLDGVLGQGAMGIVYKAFDPFIKRQVAIKLIHKDLMMSSSSEQVSMRFKLEAQAAGRFSPHNNIVTVYDFGQVDDLDDGGGRPYIVLEYVQGETLSHWLKKDPHFTLQNIYSIMSQLLNGLQYSHDNHVVHRDIKPENIFVLASGQIKISDFGIAKIDQTNITQQGMRIGTPSFMSPEQIEGKPVDGRSDLFSAGVILYLLLTGQKPFTGESLAALMHQIVNTEPPAVSELNKKLPAGVDEVVSKALAKNPADRFQTGREFALALKSTLVAGGDQPEEKKKRGMLPVALTGAAVFSLLAGAVFFFVESEDLVDSGGQGSAVHELPGAVEKTSPVAAVDSGPQKEPEQQPVVPERVIVEEVIVEKVVVEEVPGAEVEKVDDKVVKGEPSATEIFFEARGYFTSPTGVMSELRDGETLTSAESYYVTCLADRQMFFYVAQIDSLGHLFPIFPNSVISSYENPLAAGKEYIFPEESYMYLDLNVGKEQIYFVSSVNKHDAVEQLFAQSAGSSGGSREVAAQFVKEFDKLDPNYTHSIWFWHK